MQSSFNSFVNQILKQINEDIESVASVYGTDGPYDVSDGRTPKVLGPMLRRKRKKKKCIVESTDDIDYWQTEGCGIFAFVMNKLHGFPIVIFRNEDEIAHVANYVGNNNVIDSLGIRPISEVKDNYYDVEDIVCEKIPLMELESLMGFEDKSLYPPTPETTKEAKDFISRMNIPK